MSEILDKAKQWLSGTFDAETQQEIEQLITTNAPDLEDRFYTWNLEQVECEELWAQGPTGLTNIR